MQVNSAENYIDIKNFLNSILILSLTEDQLMLTCFNILLKLQSSKLQTKIGNNKIKMHLKIVSYKQNKMKLLFKYILCSLSNLSWFQQESDAVTSEANFWFFVFSCGIKLLPEITCFQSEELPLVFLVRWVFWQQILSDFVCMRMSLLFLSFFNITFLDIWFLVDFLFHWTLRLHYPNVF